MGQDMGEELSKQLGSIAKMSDHELVYELGKLAGPLLLNTLIAIIAPEIVAGLKGTRVAKRLMALLESLGDKLKFLDKWRPRRRHAVPHLPTHVPGRTAATVEKEAGRIEHAAQEVKALEAADAATGKAAEDAVKFVEQHPDRIVPDAQGYLEAPVEGGHKIVQVPAGPTGIDCEYWSPPPHIRVPCPPRMRETVEEFKKRGGVIQGEGTKLDPEDMPKSPSHVTSVSEPGLPEGYEDMPHGERRTSKQAGVGLEEDHHIASRYIEKNRAIFEKAGLSIDHDLNLIKDFPDHGQLRGWYDWKNRKYTFKMKGHHKEYNRWVTTLLEEATPAGLTPDQYLDRITRLTQSLNAVVQKYPEVLSHGPDILPLLEHLKVTWR